MKKRRSKFRGALDREIDFLDSALFFLVDGYRDDLKQFLEERGSEIDEVGRASILRSFRKHTLGLMHLANEVDGALSNPEAKTIPETNYDNDIPC